MAEVAGLVIGGVALLGFFENGMSAFDHIEEARSYGGEYQKLALKTSVLRLRLGRWAKGVELASAIKEFGTEPHGNLAKQLLGQVAVCIENTEAMSQLYQLDGSANRAIASDKKLDTIDALAAKIKAMAIRRQKHTPLRRKIRWALHDRTMFEKLISDLDYNITNLEKLFSAEARVQAQTVAKSEGQEIIQASSVQELDGDEDTPVALLAEATEGVDAVLKEALKQTVPAGKVHLFSGKFLHSEDARYLIGNYVASGNVPLRENGSIYSGSFTGTGSSRGQYGDNYGGRSVLD